MNSKKEKIDKNSLIHYQNLEEKIERNLNKEKFGLDKRHFPRKRKQMLFVCLAVHALVFLKHTDY